MKLSLLNVQSLNEIIFETCIVQCNCTYISVVSLASTIIIESHDLKY